jgi:hypothetical protein
MNLPDFVEIFKEIRNRNCYIDVFEGAFPERTQSLDSGCIPRIWLCNATSRSTLRDRLALQPVVFANYHTSEFVIFRIKIHNDGALHQFV